MSTTKELFSSEVSLPVPFDVLSLLSFFDHLDTASPGRRGKCGTIYANEKGNQLLVIVNLVSVYYVTLLMLRTS